MQAVATKAGLLYCAATFGAGVVLGTIRVLFVVPRLGVRVAELLELPLMVLISALTARWTVRVLAVPPMLAARLQMGAVALSVLLAMELALVLWVQGLTLSEAVAARDPVSGIAYLLSLLAFAAMPVLLRLGSE